MGCVFGLVRWWVDYLFPKPKYRKVRLKFLFLNIVLLKKIPHKFLINKIRFLTFFFFFGKLDFPLY